jgi:non-homologous end joining protein Ku
MSFHQKRIKLLLTEKEADFLDDILMNKHMEYDGSELDDKWKRKLVENIATKLTKGIVKK